MRLLEFLSNPKTLYVSRPVVNIEDIRQWAKDQGFRTILPDLHATIAYSNEEVNWDDTRPLEDEIKIPNGKRKLEMLGDYLVLRFYSEELQERWTDFRELGASWDFPSYKQHISLTKNTVDLDIEKIKPYKGLIVLGPELFSEVQED